MSRPSINAAWMGAFVAVLVVSHAAVAAPPDPVAAAARLIDAGKDPEGFALLDREFVLAKTSANKARIAVVARARGNALRAVGRLADSRDALLLAGDDAESLQSLGMTLEATGALTEAVLAFERAVASAVQRADATAESEATRRLGVALVASGRPPEAAAALLRGIDLATKAGLPTLACRGLADLARVHALLGDGVAALDAAHRALATLPSDATPDDESAVVWTLVRHRLHIGDTEGAIGLCPRLESSIGRGSSTRARIRMRFDVADALLGADRPNEALAFVTAALPDVEGHSSPRIHAEALLVRVSALRALGRGAGVEPVLQSASELAARAKDRPKLIEALLEQGRATRSRGDPATALVALGRALNEAEILKDRRLVVAALTEQARTQLARAETAVSLAIVARAKSESDLLVEPLDDAGRLRARRALAELASVGTQAAVRGGDAATLFAMLELGRALALLDGVGGRSAIAWATIPPALRDAEAEAVGREARARADFVRAGESGLAATMRPAQLALEAARADVAAAVDRIRREAKREAGFCRPRADTLEDVKARLEPNEALVEYGVAGERAIALIVRRDGAKIVDLGPALTMDERARATDWRDPAVDPVEPIAQLTRRLVAPLGLPDSVTRVQISAVGDLARIPFAALMPGRRIVYVPSATVAGLLHLGAGSGQKSIGFADPRLARGVRETVSGGKRIVGSGALVALSAMAGARDYVREHAEKNWLGGDATESTFREEMGGSSRWRTVLLACPTVSDWQCPPYSTLVLAPDESHDGNLTAIEVAQLRVLADLVFLSARATSVVGTALPAEAPQSLISAFLVAGAPRVVGSLWKVDDAATHALVSAFFDGWGAGVAADEALAYAQIKVREDARWHHPAYWAGWQLWGAR